jgi:Arylsulfotransferase (ASST)
MATQRRFVIWAACAAAALVAACGGGDDARVAIVATRIDDHGPIFRRAQVTLSMPAEIEVEYWAASGPRLRVTSPRATAHAIALPRLRERADYRFSVRAVAGVAEARTEGQFSTGELPAEIRAIAFTAAGRPTLPLAFLSMRSTFNGGLIVDAEGHVVWYARTAARPLGAARRANGHWVLMQDGVGLTEFSLLGETVVQLSQQQVGAGMVHHDVTATPWGTLLFLAFDPRDVGGRVLQGEALWEWSPETGALHKRWSAFDFLDPPLDAGARSVPDDWLHANSVAFGPRGNIVVSLHFLDQVISIAPDFGSIEWRLGGVRSTLAIAPGQASSGQHSAREVAVNRVLMFDNGFDRADGSRWSRALELAIDPASGAVSTQWQYRPDRDIWARIVSSVRRLPNGHSVVTFGTTAGLVGSTGPVAVHEIAPDGQLVWSLDVGIGGGAVFQGDPIESIGGEVAVAELPSARTP